MDSLFGMKIVSHSLIPPVPKIQLSRSFNACSPEFKAEMNAWLLDTFGTYIPTYIIGGNTIVCDPRIVAKLKEAQHGN